MNSTQSQSGLSRRQFLINSAAATAFLALAACAPGATGPAAEAPAEAAPAEAPAAEPTAAIGEYGSGDNPVILWHGLGGADGATFAVMLEQYAKDNGQPIRSETYG